MTAPHMTPEAIFKLRKHLGLSQRGLAIAIGMSEKNGRRNVRRWESGDMHVSEAHARAMKQLSPTSPKLIALRERYPFERAGRPPKDADCC